MDKKGFHKYLEERKLSESEIQDFISLAERFEGFARSQPSAQDVRAFSRLLIEQGINTRANFYALAHYGRFLGNNEVYVGVFDLLDDQGVRTDTGLWHQFILTDEMIEFGETIPAQKIPAQKKKTATKKKATPKKKSKKQIVFTAWKNGAGITDPQKLVDRVKGAVKISSVRTWMSWWRHGKQLPQMVA